MDCEILSENRCFTFTWIIENFSYSWLKIGEAISSPVFVVDTMGKNKWRLLLYPEGDEEKTKEFISFYIRREEDCKGPQNVVINFELSFLATDDSVLMKTNTVKQSFARGKKWYADRFVERDEVLQIRRKDYLPGNVLTARCRMWHDNEETNYGHCCARTRIGVERKSFVWNIKQFSSFRESLCEIAPTSDQSMITLKLSSIRGQNSERFVCVEVYANDQLKISTFRLYLVDSSGDRTECLDDEITFDQHIKTASFILTFSKEQLMKNKNRYLPNDVLQLYCECDTATGNMLEEIEKASYGCLSSIQEGNITSNNLKSKKVFLDPTRILKENLEFSYTENLLCDTKLKTKTGLFNAHKFILGARSPVFKAMFTTDMREKNNECVTIEDLDDDTVQRMLLYIYTATLQDLQWDNACNLYVAADKYEILSLKNECSFFLKDNLSEDNCCDLLILADTHQDEDLKSAVHDYILNHKHIFHTNQWELFMKTNLELAADLMYLKCKK
ncbi:tdpoz2 [Trichonephila clavata]|uniref:Tdpoz2 n=1 Tax=Trichonephila clavata TaxID=2740835 RepID=A0A8X6I5P1_TRICU|nr:tdpoz2 [Trichonephila clavata]